MFGDGVHGPRFSSTFWTHPTGDLRDFRNHFRPSHHQSPQALLRKASQVLLPWSSQHGGPAGPQDADKIWICIWHCVIVFKHPRIWGPKLQNMFDNMFVSCICLSYALFHKENAVDSGTQKYPNITVELWNFKGPPETSAGPSPTSAWRHLHLWLGAEPAQFWPSVSDRPSFHHSQRCFFAGKCT